MSVIERVFELELRTRRLETRLEALETGRQLPADTPAPPVVRLPSSFAPPVAEPPVAPPQPPRARPEPPARPPAPSLEDLLGGRVLAWAGGLSLLAGLLFLLVIAVSRGWIGEEARTLFAAATSLGLMVFGVRAYERHGRTDSALAATAAGIAGLFASMVVATQAYDLIPIPAGLAIALATGAAATWLALRWQAPGLATLGILGAVSAPVLVGDGLSALSVAFLFVATASAVGVVVWQRWTWLAFATFGLTTPQWVGWMFVESPSATAVLAALVGFGVLAVAAAVGFELRTRQATLEVSSHLLLVLNALVLAWAGWGALSESAGDSAAHAWLAGLAIAHLAAAAAGQRLARVSHSLVLAAAALGIVLANLAFASAVDGLPLVIGWAATGVGMAILARGAADRIDREFALAGLGGQLGLALGHALVYDAPLTAVEAGTDLAGGAALALVAAGCLVSARLARDTTVRQVLEVAGLLLVGYLAAVTLDGPALTFALAVQAATLAELARREGDQLAHVGAIAFLGLAALHVMAVVAPVEALVNGVEDPVGALALLAVAGAALAVAHVPGSDRTALQAVAAGAALYLASVEIITLFQPATDSLGGLSVRQQGQALLSGFWALVGVAALVVGLMRDRRELRIGALALLALTLAKVCLYDLASLDSMYRVASFVALGALLLLGAFAWQRLRPESPPDFRDVPPAMR